MALITNLLNNPYINAKYDTFDNKWIGATAITPSSCYRLGSVALLTAVLSACASQPSQPTAQRSQPIYIKGVPNYYIVKNGDTLSKISTQYGLDYRRVGALNGLDSNYTIYPGQRLILTSANNPTSYRPAPIRPITVNQPTSRPANYPNNYPNSYPTSFPANIPVKTTNTPPFTPPPVVPAAMSQSWLRPTTGNLLRPFNQQNGTLGMWFGGQQGATVMASQAGTVLYVGSDLPEYGKLVLIQHNSDYISAYAHLGNIAVQERQTVQAGQTIGTLGIDNTLNQPAMEFQIRYRGTPVNPSSFLK